MGVDLLKNEKLFGINPDLTQEPLLNCRKFNHRKFHNRTFA